MCFRLSILDVTEVFVLKYCPLCLNITSKSETEMFSINNQRQMFPETRHATCHQRSSNRSSPAAGETSLANHKAKKSNNPQNNSGLSQYIWTSAVHIKIMSSTTDAYFHSTTERTPNLWLLLVVNHYTSDSLWKIWLVESIHWQSVHNSLWTWHDKCNICCRYCIYHVKFNVCLVTTPLGVFSSKTKWLNNLLLFVRMNYVKNV